MSLMEEANANASIIAMTVPLVLYLWQARHLSTFLALFVVLPIFVTALVLTSSVTGLSAAFLGAFVFVLANFKPMFFGRALLLLGGIAVFLAAGGIELLPKTFQKRVLAPIETGDIETVGTFADRVVLMREAVTIIEKNPVVGVGGDQFRRLSSSKQPVHNIYLLLWVEGGILALLGWLAILFSGAVAGFEAFMSRQYRLTGAVAFSLTAVVVFIGMNTPHMYGRYWVMPFFLATALAVNATSRLVSLPRVKVRQRA
jgi:O-antigen ligase